MKNKYLLIFRQRFRRLVQYSEEPISIKILLSQKIKYMRVPFLYTQNSLDHSLFLTVYTNKKAKYTSGFFSYSLKGVRCGFDSLKERKLE